MAAGDEKAEFRCLDAARCAVAVAVTVLILVVVVYAVVTVLRPGNLSIKIVTGYVPVKNASSSSSQLSMDLTIRAINLSGRVRIYFTGITGNFTDQNNSASPAEDFLVFQVPDIAVGQQESAEYPFTTLVTNNSNALPGYFNKLFYGGKVPKAMLKLSGKRIVETSSGHNDTDTGKPVVYYCPSIVIGGEEPEEPTDLQCSDSPPASATS